MQTKQSILLIRTVSSKIPDQSSKKTLIFNEYMQQKLAESKKLASIMNKYIGLTESFRATVLNFPKASV